MPKVDYEGIKFDSQLEVDYYKHLKEQTDIHNFYYNNQITKPIYLNEKNKYTPDFIVVYSDRIEIIETKGFNQFSYMRDNIVHNHMLELRYEELQGFIFDNLPYLCNQLDRGMPIVYKKIKYLKSFGWVDFDFKNPNTLSNKRKQKVEELTLENKKLKQEIKNFNKYFEYLFKDKLTSKQVEWYNEFIKKKREENL